MLTPETFEQMVAALEARGLERSQATDYAARIGDTIEEDEAGKWIVRDDGGQIIDRIHPLWED